MSKSDRDRFERKHEVAPSGCWLWTAGTTSHGYGQLFVDGKVMYAHRYSWLIHHGEIPDGLKVCHRCDTPGCVRPDHLFLGTQAANMADMVRKNRHYRLPRPDNRGAANGQAKLTEDAVRAIRADRRSCSKVAAEYGVSITLISQIRTRQRWRHVP